MLIFFSLYALRRPRSRPDNFQFHLVFLPAANFLSREEVRVIAEVARAIASDLALIRKFSPAPIDHLMQLALDSKRIPEGQR